MYRIGEDSLHMTQHQKHRIHKDWDFPVTYIYFWEQQRNNIVNLYCNEWIFFENDSINYKSIFSWHHVVLDSGLCAQSFKNPCVGTEFIIIGEMWISHRSYCCLPGDERTSLSLLTRITSQIQSLLVPACVAG